MKIDKFAIFRDGKQISRAFFTRSAAEYVALAEGYVIHMAADMPGDKSGDVLADGYEVRGVADD